MEPKEKLFLTEKKLLCEDNEINRHVICLHLVRLGFMAVIAEDGKEGSDIILYRLQKEGNPFDTLSVGDTRRCFLPRTDKALCKAKNVMRNRVSAIQ